MARKRFVKVGVPEETKAAIVRLRKLMQAASDAPRRVTEYEAVHWAVTRAIRQIKESP